MTTPFTPADLQRLYTRLHTHYIGVFHQEDFQESRIVNDLIEPEAFYRELATFAHLLMTAPTSARTQAVARTYQDHLSAIHQLTITDLTNGEPTQGCICMREYLEGKCERYRGLLANPDVPDEDKHHAVEALRKWEDRLSRLE